MNSGSITVGALIEKINLLLAGQLGIAGIWISGEVSSLTKHYSGHYYFTLKDEKGQIPCTMWRSAASTLRFNLQEGMKVQVQGTVSVYEKSGRMQLNVRTMKPEGIGALFAQLEELKARLAAQGYFEPSHKKPKPAYIEDLAVVTGASTAALQDVLKTISRRWPMMKVHLYPAMVQGEGAPASIIHALKKADSGHHDAILLVRGGGSFEDLFCFSNEELVKTIYGLQTYLVSGIGHEIDWTLSDFVSDHRAVTPTAAAEWVSWDQEEIRRFLAQSQQFYLYRIQMLLSSSWQQLNAYENNPYLADPAAFFKTRQIQLDTRREKLLSAGTSFLSLRYDLEAKQKALLAATGQLLKTSRLSLEHLEKQLDAERLKLHAEQRKNLLAEKKKQLVFRMQEQLQSAEKTLQFYTALLNSQSPDEILKRGYARIEQNGKNISRLSSLDNRDPFTILMQDGSRQAQLVNTEE